MKKIILLNLLLLLSLILCSCGEPSANDVLEQYGKMGFVIKHGDEIWSADESWLPSIPDTKSRNDFELKVNEMYVMNISPLYSTTSDGYLERLIDLTYDESVFEITPAYGDEYWHIRDATYCLTVKKEVEMATIVVESDIYKSRGVIVITAKE